MKNIERRKFIGSVVSVFGMLSLEGSGSGNFLMQINEQDTAGRTIRLKGKPDSRIIHYDIITIGNLSRNRYWGESDATGVRSAICTCSIITGKDFHLIIGIGYVCFRDYKLVDHIYIYRQTQYYHYLCLFLDNQEYS